METRSKRKRALTEREIATSIAMNSDDENELNAADYADEIETPIDEHTDSESDAVYNEEEEEEEDSEEETTEDEEEGATTDKYICTDGTEWTKQPQTIQHSNVYRRQTLYHKVILPPGKHIEDVSDAFRYIFDETVVNVIVRYKNIEAAKKVNGWKPVTVIEMYDFIGLLIAAGVLFSHNINNFPSFIMIDKRKRLK